MSARKRFSATLYSENDEIARNFVKNALKGSEYQVVDNPKKRGVDLLLYKDSKHVANIEVEIKRVWKTPNFPYESVQIPDRKTKYTLLKEPTIFVMLNDDQSSYLAIPQDVLVSSPKKEVPNKYMYKGEYFYQVPVDKVKFNDLSKTIEEVLSVKQQL